jgi:signal transduction histidine kinase
MTKDAGLTEAFSGSDGLASKLRLLSDPDSLILLQALLKGSLTVAELAKQSSIPATAVRQKLLGLTAGGLVRKGGGAPVRFSANDIELQRLLSGLAARLNGGAGTAQGAETGANIGLLDTAVARPPQACITCDNSGFVHSTLEELETVLDAARRYRSRLQEMSSQVLEAQEAERKRIARELHDDTAQALTSILIRLRLVEHTVQDEKVRAALDELRDLVALGLDSVRRMAMDLRPAALDDLGLAPALQSYAGKFSERWGIKVSARISGLEERLPADVELVLYRVAQEALTNAAKHAGASYVGLTLSRKGSEVTLTVTDDGRGFDQEEQKRKEGAGLGLFGMGERLALVGGALSIDSLPGKGTTVSARLPLEREGVT